MSFTVIDWIFVGMMVLFGVICMGKGFVESFVGKAVLILAIFAGIFFAPRFEALLMEHISIHFLVVILSFLIGFIVSFIVLKILQILIDKLFSGAILGGLNRALGFIWGLLEGFIIGGVLIVLLNFQPFYDASELLTSSFFADLILPFIGDGSAIKDALNITLANTDFRMFNV